MPGLVPGIQVVQRVRSPSHGRPGEGRDPYRGIYPWTSVADDHRKTQACGYGSRPSPGRQRRGSGVNAQAAYSVIARSEATKQSRVVCVTLDCRGRFAPRNDGGETCNFLLAARFARDLLVVDPPSNQRAQGRPGGRMHPGRSRKKIIAQRASPQVQAVTTGLPCAMGYGLYVISSVNLADCHRPPRCASRIVGVSAEPLGRQDHTISPSASAPLVSQRLHVHRSPPHVRDDAYAPLVGVE